MTQTLTDHEAINHEAIVGDDTRARILAVAHELLAQGGREALTTRAVASAAGVQAPAIYRIFGDKSGLLDAVAERGFAAYVKSKEGRKFGPDAVADLRHGWDLHVEFGLAHPAIYALIYGDPRPGAPAPAAAAGYKFLEAHIHRLALAGRLRLSEARAAELMHASARGTVLTLLEKPGSDRDLGLSRAAREAVIAAIATETAVVESSGLAAAANALRAVLPDTATVLTEGERHVLSEWLDRLANVP